MVRTPTEGQITIKGNTFSGFAKGLRVGGPQVAAVEIRENTWAYNKSNIVFESDFVHYNPATNPNDPNVVLKCNKFLFAPGYPSTGVVVEQGATLSGFGSCDQKSGNAWPFALPLVNNPVSPQGWVSISSNPLLVYHQYKNEFVGATNSSALASKNCNTGLPINEKEWGPLTATNTEGCPTIVDPIYYTFYRRATSLNVAKKNTIKVYPNPSKNSFWVEGGGQSVSNYKITDATGRIVFSKADINVAKFEVKASLPNGLYILWLQNNDSDWTTTKISVQ